jgi:hypothetical protein
MAQQGVNVFTALPVKNNLFDLNDRFLFLFGADTANTSNSVAQTASISAVNLFQNSQLIIAANTISAQTVTANSFIANNIQANSYNMFFGQPLITASFNLSAAQIANCSANVVTIVPAQGANTIIVPIAVWAYSSIGNPWSVSGQVGLWLGAANSSSGITDDGTLAAVITANNYFGYSTGLAFGQLTTISDAALIFASNNASPPSSGNVSITGVLQYIVLENMPL